MCSYDLKVNVDARSMLQLSIIVLHANTHARESYRMVLYLNLHLKLYHDM